MTNQTNLVKNSVFSTRHVLVLAACLSCVLLGLGADRAHAGYIDTSGGWKQPQEQGMNRRHAVNIAGQCQQIKSRSANGGQAGAMIVAGPHTTAEDPKVHLTVRLYNEQGQHDKSCHVYVNSKDQFSGCNCK